MKFSLAGLLVAVSGVLTPGAADAGVEPSPFRLTAVHGISATRLFAVGDAGALTTFDGKEWRAVGSPTTAHLTGVWVTSSSSVWVVGHQTILRGDGTSFWITETPKLRLHAIWGASESEVWAVGEQGTILRYDGRDWTEVSSRTDKTLTAVWGTGSGDVWFAGAAGTVVHWDGRRLQVKSEPSPYFTGLGGLGRREVWAVGEDGGILRFDGREWLASASHTSLDLYAVTTAPQLPVWAVGEEGTVLRFQDGKWKAVASGTNRDLFAAWTSPSAELVAVGDHVTLRLPARSVQP